MAHGAPCCLIQRMDPGNLDQSVLNEVERLRYELDKCKADEDLVDILRTQIAGAEASKARVEAELQEAVAAAREAAQKEQQTLHASQLLQLQKRLDDAEEELRKRDEQKGAAAPSQDSSTEIKRLQSSLQRATKAQATLIRTWGGKLKDYKGQVQQSKEECEAFRQRVGQLEESARTRERKSQVAPPSPREQERLLELEKEMKRLEGDKKSLQEQLHEKDRELDDLTSAVKATDRGNSADQGRQLKALQYKLANMSKEKKALEDELDGLVAAMRATEKEHDNAEEEAAARLKAQTALHEHELAMAKLELEAERSRRSELEMLASNMSIVIPPGRTERSDSIFSLSQFELGTPRDGPGYNDGMLLPLSPVKRRGTPGKLLSQAEEEEEDIMDAGSFMQEGALPQRHADLERIRPEAARNYQTEADHLHRQELEEQGLWHASTDQSWASSLLDTASNDAQALADSARSNHSTPRRAMRSHTQQPAASSPHSVHAHSVPYGGNMASPHAVDAQQRGASLGRAIGKLEIAMDFDNLPSSPSRPPRSLTMQQVDENKDLLAGLEEECYSSAGGYSGAVEEPVEELCGESYGSGCIVLSDDDDQGEELLRRPTAEE